MFVAISLCLELLLYVCSYSSIFETASLGLELYFCRFRAISLCLEEFFYVWSCFSMFRAGSLGLKHIFSND